MRPLPVLVMACLLSAGSCMKDLPLPERPFCPPLKEYSPEFEKRLAARLAIEPSDSPFIPVVRDLAVLRRQCGHKPRQSQGRSE